MIADLKYSRLHVDGYDYVITYGTGEGVAFAYEADVFDDAFSRTTTYQDFCDAISPVEEGGWLRQIAIVAAAKLRERVAVAGSCRPVLSDAEYELVCTAARLL